MSKTVYLNLPRGSRVQLTGAEKDRSIIGAIEASQGFYEKHVMSKLMDILEPDFICLDVGANIGALSFAFAEIASKGKVYSIEAGKANYKYLADNIKKNGFNNIIPIYKAVSDHNGIATFNYVEDVAGCSFISTTGVEVGQQEQVVVTTIDDLVKKLELKSLDFIKLDVEGGERKALAGANKAIEKFHPALLIEWNPETICRFYGEDPKDLFELLISKWSTIELLEDDCLSCINTYDELCEKTNAGKGWEDLICRF